MRESYASLWDKREPILQIFLHAKTIGLNMPDGPVRLQDRFLATNATFSGTRTLNQFNETQFPNLESIEIDSCYWSEQATWGMDKIKAIKIYDDTARNQVFLVPSEERHGQLGAGGQN